MEVDISNIAEDNHNYAIHLATLQNFISYKNSTFKIAGICDCTPFEAVDFWRNISLSAEILLKASLLKHNIAFLKKRAHGKYGDKVTANDNQWLKSRLEELEIEYLAEINTGTVSTALKRAEAELFEKVSLNPKEGVLISEMFYIIIRTRRNRNNHFYFPNQNSVDLSDVEILYLPLLNRLEEIYNR